MGCGTLVKRGFFLGLTALVVASGLALARPHTTAADTARSCNQYSVPVSLVEGGPSYHIAGWLCKPADTGGQKSGTVELLLSGGTYGHVYWDFPYQPNNYSYVDSAVNAGYATFNIDRIGIGQSDHPDPELITVQSNAFVAHQVVQDLRHGSIDGNSYGRVVLASHSIGSAIAWVEASQYQDVNGVIVTGLIHAANDSGSSRIATDFYPAAFDPRFQSQNLPLGYLTTKPQTRSELFYNSADADSNVIAADEASKETVTDNELNTFFPLLGSPISRGITVPVMIQEGQFDNFSCGQGSPVDCSSEASIKAYEAPYYSPQACLQVHVLANSGHDINLHYGAVDWFNNANNWVSQYVIGHSQNGCGQ